MPTPEERIDRNADLIKRITRHLENDDMRNATSEMIRLLCWNILMACDDIDGGGGGLI